MRVMRLGLVLPLAVGAVLLATVAVLLVSAPPCMEPVKTYRTRVENGMVVIEA